MNEQAIIDSYNLFVGSGYKKSLQEFKQLLASNPEAVNDSYGLFQQNGYRKSLDEYKSLMGIGAAVESPMAVEEQPKKKGATVSPFVDGGSELTKFDPRTGQVVQETPEFTKPKEKDFSGIEVKLQDEKILTKQPKVERPIVSSESTKADPDQIDFDGKLAKQKVSAPMSYSNIFSKTIADLPSDLGESWAVASAFIERQLGKAGVPGANPNLTARDLHTYDLANDWRKYTDEVFPTNQEDRSTFLGGVVSGLGQAVPMVMSGGISAVSKSKAAMDIAKTALSTGTKLTPFINMGKDIAKQAASPSGLIGGSQMSSAMYRQAIDSGATEDQAQQYAIENFFVGTVAESLPVQSMFSRILKKEPTANILRILKEGSVGAVEELTTEMWQTTYENWSAQRIYDFNREMLDGVGEAGAVGGTVGFILNTALAALVGRRAKVKTKEEEIILDKSIDEVESKINTVNKNNKNISEVADELDSIEPIVLNYGDSKYFFAKDKSGRMELAEDPMLEDQAKSMANMLGKVYKGLEFSIEEVMSNDPYAPVKYNVIANEKINKQQNAIQEQAAGQVPVQSGAGVSQEVAEGISQAEPQGVTQEGQVQEVVDPLKDVESTTNAFANALRDSAGIINDRDSFNAIYDIVRDGDLFSDVREKAKEEGGGIPQRAIAEKYHESKANGTNPDFVQLVENAFIRQAPTKQEAVPAIIQSGAGVSQEVAEGISQAEPQDITQEGQAKEVDVFHGGSVNDIQIASIDNPLYVSESESQSAAYAKGNQGKVAKFKVDKSKIANEEEVRNVINDLELKPKDESWSVDELNIYELIDPNFDTAMSDESINNLFEELERRGYGGAEFLGMNIETLKNDINDIVIFNPKLVTKEGQAQEVVPTQEVEGEVEFNEDEVNTLSNLLDKSEAEGKNLPEVFQLETTTDNEVKKQVLVESATKLMETVSDDLSSTSKLTNAPTMEPTPIVITENTELTNKVPRFPLVDLIKKKINLVMADQLKVGDGFMGGPLFPLIDGIFGKAAWASINLDAARKIARGAINGDYSVVFNMNPTAVDSNTAFMDTFIKKLNDAGIKENVLVELKSYVKDKKFGKKTDQIRKITEESTTIDEFSERLSELDVDTISDFVKKIIPSKSVVAETPIGKILQAQNITQEDIRGEISEQLAKDLPMGAMTMVLKITDANGNPVTEKNIDDAIITPEQQRAEGIPSHRNYPFYVRGTVVGILDSTVPFWNMSKAAMSTINAKVAKVIRNNEGKAYSASQARAAAMRSASMKASKAFTTQAPTKSTYQQFIERLSKAIPSVEVVTSQKEFDDLLTNLNAKSLATKNQKIYGAVLDGKLYLNPSLENFNTPIHEFAHVWTNTIKELSPEIYQKGIDLIKGSEYVAQIEGSKDYKRITDKMKKDGATEQEIRDYILEEALATAVGDKGESFATASQQRNFKNWLNDLFQFIKKLTGISKLNPEQIQDLNLDDFLNSVVVDLLSEKPIFKNAEVKNLSNQLQLMARPDLKADDIVKIGLANGFSEGSIRELLKRRGFTQTEINRSVASTVQAAKKVEVTEEFAPGYDRMITELEGVVEKSLKRGTTQVRAMENAINYLQGTKVYENATDVQREQMVRDVNKRFKKREKRAPTAEKVVGKPKKKEVTVDEMVALKDQIKLEARAAREAKGDLNTKRKALAARIIAARRKGTITAAQARALVNRISKVNLDNPIMVDRLLAYIEKVFDNANYAADMAELRKLQKQARSRNHASMTNVVKQFTSINPENIPLDRIQEYKKALDFLNNLTPSYATMNEILDEMLSYQVTEEFDAVKTLEALEKKYESIQLNEVGSVEEYRNLIKDINSFKRKAFQLLQNEEITQEQYDDLIKMVGEDQQTIEEDYKDEITKIKKDLIAEIKNQRPKVSRDFSNVENDLIRKYLELSDSDLESLSPEDLFVLNDLLENISNGEIDVSRFGPIVSKAYTSSGLDPLAKQINKSKFDKSSEEGRQELSEQESSFWEGLLGMGRAKAGALQKLIISPFNRAIGSYEKFSRDGLNEFLKLKNKYKIDSFDPLKISKDMHKIGMLTTYLQEYMAQFDSKNEGVKDIGKRDWFKEIINNRAMRDNYSSGKPSVLKSIGLGKSELDIIEEIWKSLPKNKDGNVDPKAVYDSYMANDGKFFTKKQKAFFDDVMAYKAAEITPKQKFANELSGASFKEIPFHMMRVRLDKGKSQIAPSASSENNNVRISAGTGKERVSEKVGAVMTNFEKLFISGIEQTGRDYFLSNTLQDINNTLAGVKKILGDKKIELINTISYTLSDALKFEFDRTKSNFIFRNLLSARAAQTLLRPIRTAVELGSTLVSYPVRAKTLSGYKSLFGEQGAMKKLLEFTDSPMLLRDNISKAIDINDGSIEPQSSFTKATNYLSGLPERTMMVTSWMPTFKSEFKNITGIDFDMKKFNDSSAYREKYGKAIRESSAAADSQTEKIIGPTTKAGQRREIRIAPRVLANIFGSEGTVSKNTATGQILGFFSNYPFRESTEFLNGFREAAEVLNDEGALSSLSQLQKPLGVALNVAAYSFLSSATYALSLMLLGDEDDEERGEDLLKALLTGEGLLEELKSNAISLAGSQYAAGGKALIQLAATILIESTDDEELKAKYKKLLKDSVFIDPLPVDKALGFKGEEEIAGSIGKYIPPFIIAYARYVDLIGTKNEIKEIYDKVERKGVDALTEDEGLKILALNTAFNSAQLVLNLYGTSLPEYNYIKTYMKKLKEEAGVADVYKGEVPAKKSSKGGGGSKAKPMNKTDMKRYFPEQYDQLYGPNSPGYEIQQQVKEFEKQQRDLEKSIKDQIYGVKD